MTSRRKNKPKSPLPPVVPTRTTTLTCSHLNSRKDDKGGKPIQVGNTCIVIRRKRCLDCGIKFRTVEMVGEINAAVFSDYLLNVLTTYVNHTNNPLGWLWEYSPQRLRDHLRSHLPDGVSLKQIGKAYVITHVKPLADFSYPFPDEDQFHLAWALLNLTVKPKNP